MAGYRRMRRRHRLRRYDSVRSLSDPEPFMRGINSIQLVWHEGRWWVTSIVWDFERPDNPIPSVYLPDSGSGAGH